MRNRLAAGGLALTFALASLGGECTVLTLGTALTVQAEDAAETTSEAPTETPSEEMTEAPSEDPTEATTEDPTETASGEPTEAPSEEPTETPTEAPSEESIEVPTEAPTLAEPMAPSLVCYSVKEEDASISEIVRWNQLDGITGYEVELSQNEDFSSPFYQKNHEPDSLSIRLRKNTPGSVCYVRIRSYCTAGDQTVYSPYSVTKYQTPTFADTSVTAPVFTNIKLTNDDKLQLFWVSVAGADHYEIDFSADPAFSTNLGKTTAAPKDDEIQSRWIRGFQKDTTYFCRVRAVVKGADGTEQYSDYAYMNLLLPSSFKLLYGDADSNGAVNSADAASILINAAAVGSGDASPLTDIQFMSSDINADGIVDASDATSVLLYAAAIGAGQTDVKITDFV